SGAAGLMLAVERRATRAVPGEAVEERSLLTALGPFRLPTAGGCTSERERRRAPARGYMDSSPVTTRHTDARLGLASFIDKPLSRLGGSGDYVYQVAAGGQITNSHTTFVNAIQGLVLGWGDDAPQSQLESLMQLANHAADLGYRSGSQRFVVMMTDAEFHKPGDCTACTHANNGDGIIDPLEDYPSVAQVANALVAANITPIFAVTEPEVAVYEQLTHDLAALGVNQGSVVTLADDSSNIVNAVLTGLKCPAH
ncbi:MAG TPA: hypothetical protein VF516_09920, partial [Kofleriaceae bacterium]